MIKFQQIIIINKEKDETFFCWDCLTSLFTEEVVIPRTRNLVHNTERVKLFFSFGTRCGRDLPWLQSELCSESRHVARRLPQHKKSFTYAIYIIGQYKSEGPGFDSRPGERLFWCFCLISRSSHANVPSTLFSSRKFPNAVEEVSLNGETNKLITYLLTY